MPHQERCKSQLVPVILSGGTGTRLWPLSRASYPKQYWAMTGAGEETLLQQSLAGIDGLQPPLLICNEDHRFNCCAEAKGYVAEQMRQIGSEPAVAVADRPLRREARSRHRLSNPGKMPVELIRCRSAPSLAKATSCASKTATAAQAIN